VSEENVLLVVPRARPGSLVGWTPRRGVARWGWPAAGAGLLPGFVGEATRTPMGMPTR
jgi:hypothetical protein